MFEPKTKNCKDLPKPEINKANGKKNKSLSKLLDYQCKREKEESFPKQGINKANGNKESFPKLKD